jgi:two-component system response regulator YesN
MEGLKWYHRSLLTYLPIIFFMITVIASISFLVVNDISSKQAHHANRVFTSYIHDTIDSRLRETEYSIVNDIVSNSAIQSFLSPDASHSEYDYRVSEEIRKLISRYSLINSVELLRFRDQIVLTSGDRKDLSNFADRDYIASRMDQPSSVDWSKPRRLKYHAVGTDFWVISMTKKVPIPFGDEGLVIINVNLSSLMSTIDQLKNDITFIQLWDSGEMLYPFSEVASNDSRSRGASEVITSMTSPYSGLTIKSGLKSAVILSWVSALSYIWIGVGVIVIILGILLLIYISKRNYRPIEQIIRQIHQYQSRTPMDRNENELSFIHDAIEQLIRQTRVYEKERQEDSVIRRKQFFQELIEGERHISLPEWEEAMKRFELKHRFVHITFILIEVDDYREFCAKYSYRDQNLLKFALANAMIEMAGHDSCDIWGEWISGPWFAVLVYNKDASLLSHRNKAIALCEKLGVWVMKNLHFTLSAGIGHTGKTIDRLPDLFEESQYALKFKLTLGNNRIYDITRLKEDNKDSDAYKFLQTIRTINEGFRLNTTWKEQLKQMFSMLRSHPLPEDEIMNLVNYLLYLFNRNVAGLRGDLSDYWNQQLLPELYEALEQATELEQIERALTHNLFEMYDAFQLQMAAKSHHSLVKEIRKYIEGHYTDPDLSLKDISDRYKANGKYISQLFKEEFGEKFVDFLVNLRMERAKQLLVGTEHSLQDIALAVGYTNPISFGRTFKKNVGITPMDYRKMMSTQKENPLKENGKSSGFQ